MNDKIYFMLYLNSKMIKKFYNLPYLQSKN